MRYTVVLLMLAAAAVYADPLACPTGTFADYITAGTCTISGYTLSNFSFSSTAQNLQSTAYTADEFGSTGVDSIDPHDGSFYVGIQFLGDPSAPAGDDVQTILAFDVTSTDGDPTIAGVALQLLAGTGTGGSVTLDDLGKGDTQPFFIQTTSTSPVAQHLFTPNVSTVHEHAVLKSTGPDEVKNFDVVVLDASNVPEPAAWSLSAFGFLALGGFALHKRRAQAAR